MELSQSNQTLLDGLKGNSIVDWHVTEGGMHFDLSDGRVVIFAGSFVIAVYGKEDAALH